MNRLLFSDDGRDDYLCAEHYVMLGNWDRDPDRYGRMREIASGFLRSVYGEDVNADTLDSWMNVPDNARELVGTGTPEDSAAGVSSAGSAGRLGAPARRRARHGKRDRVLLRRTPAHRVAPLDQSATAEERVGRSHRMRPRGTAHSGARQAVPQ